MMKSAFITLGDTKDLLTALAAILSLGGGDTAHRYPGGIEKQRRGKLYTYS